MQMKEDKFGLQMDLEVRLLKDYIVRDYLSDVGYFASICKDSENNVQNYTRTKLESIGLDCIRSGHMSPARATYFWFSVGPMSRACSHQLVRSRVGVEINQQSQRSCMLKDGDFMVPPTILNSPEALETFLEVMHTSFNGYKRLIELGIPLEDARYALIEAGFTQMNIAITPQALFKLANERLCKKAQWEIRNIVSEMVHEVLNVEPRLSEFLVPKCVALHGCNERQSCGYYATLKANNVSPIAQISTKQEQEAEPEPKTEDPVPSVDAMTAKMRAMATKDLTAAIEQVLGCKFDIRRFYTGDVVRLKPNGSSNYKGQFNGTVTTISASTWGDNEDLAGKYVVRACSGYLWDEDELELVEPSKTSRAPESYRITKGLTK